MNPQYLYKKWYQNYNQKTFYFINLKLYVFLIYLILVNNIVSFRFHGVLYHKRKNRRTKTLSKYYKVRLIFNNSIIDKITK